MGPRRKVAPPLDATRSVTHTPLMNAATQSAPVTTFIDLLAAPTAEQEAQYAADRAEHARIMAEDVAAREADGDSER